MPVDVVFDAAVIYSFYLLVDALLHECIIIKILSFNSKPYISLHNRAARGLTSGELHYLLFNITISSNCKKK